MVRQNKRIGWLVAVCLLAVATTAAAQQIPNPPPTSQGQNAGASGMAADEAIDYRMRGPLHEAFANPYANDPEPGLIVDREPPEPVHELPPELKPEGDYVTWIPGYWAFDEEENGFLWVSGMWRNIPPDRTWVPGYWNRVNSGWQWVSGFWTSAARNELAYMDEPPRTLEQGPTSDPPSVDYFWVPGVWIWQQTGYAWRPGFWAPGRQDWVWVPAHYVWTPRGFVFVDGYWDYQLDDRGVLFCPVYYRQPVYLTTNYIYRPSVVVDLNPLLVHLFVRPRYCHYYFGDYYASQYSTRYGILPWVNISIGSRYYDPLFTYYRWSYQRRGVDFVNRVQGWHGWFEQHESYRPPHWYRQRDDFAARHRDADWLSLAVVGESLERYANRADHHPLERLDNTRREQFGRSIREVSQISQQRIDFEKRTDSRVGRDETDRGNRRDDGIRARMDLPNSDSPRPRADTGIDARKLLEDRLDGAALGHDLDSLLPGGRAARESADERTNRPFGNQTGNPRQDRGNPNADRPNTQTDANRNSQGLGNAARTDRGPQRPDDKQASPPDLNRPDPRRSPPPNLDRLNDIFDGRSSANSPLLKRPEIERNPERPNGSNAGRPGLGVPGSLDNRTRTDVRIFPPRIDGSTSRQEIPNNGRSPNQLPIPSARPNTTTERPDFTLPRPNVDNRPMPNRFPSSGFVDPRDRSATESRGFNRSSAVERPSFTPNRDRGKTPNIDIPSKQPRVERAAPAPRSAPKPSEPKKKPGKK